MCVTARTFSRWLFFSDVTQLMNVTLLYGWSTIQFRWNVSRSSENIIKNEQNYSQKWEEEEEESDVWSMCPRLTKLTCAPIASCTYFLLKYLRIVVLLVFHRVLSVCFAYRYTCDVYETLFFFFSCLCMALWWWKLQLQMTKTDVNQRTVKPTRSSLYFRTFFFLLSNIQNVSEWRMNRPVLCPVCTANQYSHKQESKQQWTNIERCFMFH